MKIETVSLAELKPLERNVRKHGEAQIEAFVQALNQFGQTRPFVIDEEGRVLVGNGMLLAMQRRGDASAYAYRLTGLTEAQKKKLVITDNKMYSLGYDDFEAIEATLKEIVSGGDFDIAGFEPESLKLLVAEPESLRDIGMDYGRLETPTPAPAEPVSASPAPAPAPASAAAWQGAPAQEDAQAEAYGMAQPRDAFRTVVCPNCGEVIRL